MRALAVSLLVLCAAGRSSAQCCACQGCSAQGFCVDGLADSVACATLCGDAGCPNIAFQDGDTCADGCDGQPELSTATPTGTPTGTATATATDTPSPTATGGATSTATPSGAATATHTPAATPTNTNPSGSTATTTPTGTPTGTAAATATDTPSVTPTASGMPTGTATATATASATGAHTPTVTPTVNGTATVTATAGVTATSTPTGNATATPTDTSAGTPSHTPNTTPTATASSTASPTQLPPAVVDVGTAVGGPGTVAGFAVTFSAGVAIPSGTVCVGYDPLTPIRAIAAETPDCTPLAVLPQSLAFQPEGCDPHLDCSFVCAVLDVGTTPPQDVTLFTCRVAIAAAAPVGTYPLSCTAIIAGVDILCNDGSVIVQNRLPGDCNGDGMVTIDELILGVNIALDLQPVTACPAFDTDASGGVSINELIAAVNAALM